ncbi:MAG: hypothetical protein IPG45_06045 [Deltaproteobacteria bacterium]|nr:hypothetical protein [Deltaproteobacteria bacterium]
MRAYLLAFWVAGVGLGAARPALAAFPTRVLSALEEDEPLPDVHVTVGFERNDTRAKIVREWVQRVAGEDPAALDVKELKYRESSNTLLLDVRVGIFRDLELHIGAPIVLSGSSSIEFEDGVANFSTIWGSNNANDPAVGYRYPLTPVPAERNRAGFGDMRFGLGWSPLTDRKDEAYPTLTFRADLIAPTGKVRDPQDQNALPGGSGGGVGLGQTIFDLSIGMNKRMRGNTPAFDPYMMFGTQLPVATGAQKERGMEPPITARFQVGTEVIAYEDPATDQFYAVDLSFQLKYIGIGRTYSYLSDYLPNFDQTKVERDLPIYTDYADGGNYTGAAAGTSCGLLMGVPCGELNRVDEHLQMKGTFALHLKPMKYFTLRGGVSVGFTTEHLLTTERVGTDTDPADAINQRCPSNSDVDCVGRVNAQNSLGQDERSPYYDPRYDAPGRRLRAEEIVDLTFFINAIATF